MQNKQFAIATFNTWGIPILSPYSLMRYKIIADKLEQTSIDIINFQEVYTYFFLNLLKKRLPSYQYISYKPSTIGPRGALVTFSRHPIEISYKSFSVLSKIKNPRPNGRGFVFRFVSRFARLLVSLHLRPDGRSFRFLGINHKRISFSFDFRNKGVLITKLTNLPLTILNTHLTANTDNDWSVKNRYYFIQQNELIQLTNVLNEITKPNGTVLISGDFNVAKESELYYEFIRLSEVKDAFKGNLEPTYHKEYLPSGRNPHCIDYIFYSSKKINIKISHAALLFRQKEQLPNKKNFYLSDHIGLLARFKFF